MKKSFFYIGAAIACLAVIGCNSKSKQLQGTWKIDMTKLPASATTGPAAAFAKQLLGSISVEFKSDNTFAAHVDMSAIPGATASKANGDQQGTWKLDGNTVTMTPTSGGGNKTPGTATLSEDGKTLTLVIPGQNQSLAFAKQG